MVSMIFVFDLYRYGSNLGIPDHIKYYLFRSLSHKDCRKRSSSQNINLEDSLLEIKEFNFALICEEEMIEAERSIEKKINLKQP